MASRHRTAAARNDIGPLLEEDLSMIIRHSAARPGTCFSEDLTVVDSLAPGERMLAVGDLLGLDHD